MWLDGVAILWGLRFVVSRSVIRQIGYELAHAVEISEQVAMVSLTVDFHQAPGGAVSWPN
jgi:hypothetical protein